MNRLKWTTTTIFIFLVIIFAQTIPTSDAVNTTESMTSSGFSSLMSTSTPTAALIAQENCMLSFSEFAYFGTVNLTTRTTLPSAPWQYETVIPYDPNEYHLRGYPDFVIDLARQIDGEEEVWVSGWEQDTPVWLIYRPKSRTWEQVSRQIDGTIFFGTELFVSPDGSLWTNIEWGLSSNEIPDPQTFPILSQFNEATRRFEVPESVIEIPLVEEKLYGGYSFGPWPKIVLDEQGMFWIFVQYDGIYQYDPVTETNEKRVEYSEFPVVYVALAPDGNIYFSNPIGVSHSAVVDGMILQFNPSTGVVTPVDSPDEPWPIFREMLFDRFGRLWLGSTGYRDLEGNWHLIIPNPEEAFDHAGDYWWVRPFLLTKSSDGRLWFTRFIDGEGDGTAWYDPEIGEGCLFTDYSSTVMEDTNQQLWMIAGGNLYKYALNSP